MYSEGGLCTCRLGLSSNHVILVWVGRIWYEVISRLIWYISAQLCREHWIYSIEEWLPMWGVVWTQYTRGTSSFLLLLWWKFDVLLAYSANDGISLMDKHQNNLQIDFINILEKNGDTVCCYWVNLTDVWLYNDTNLVQWYTSKQR